MSHIVSSMPKPSPINCTILSNYQFPFIKLFLCSILIHSIKCCLCRPYQATSSISITLISGIEIKNAIIAYTQTVNIVSSFVYNCFEELVTITIRNNQDRRIHCLHGFRKIYDILSINLNRRVFIILVPTFISYHPISYIVLFLNISILHPFSSMFN